MAVYIAVFVGEGVSDAQAFQFLCQLRSQDKLSFGGWHGGAGDIGLGAVLYIL